MLHDLTLLLETVPGRPEREQYEDAVLVQNCLGKRTMATRKASLQRLTELYGLESHVILFRMLTEFWQLSEHSRPLLALLVALARDPLLRATAPAVVGTPFGHEFARQSMKDVLAETIGDRLSEATLGKVVRNASSSWTQSGHFAGRGHKTRQKVEPTSHVTAFAILLGYATGRRGRRLFDTPWVAILDTSAGDLIELAVDAKRLGLLDLKQSGSIMEISFPMHFNQRVRGIVYGAH